MLGKLIKHEYKATYRTLLLLYGGLLLLTLLNKVNLMIDIDNPILDTVQSFMMFLYVIIIFATFVVTIIVVIMRFYKNLLGDEGYLSFTLPVSVSKHLISKLVVAATGLMTSVVAIIISLFVLLWDADMIELINKAWNEFKILLENNGAALFVIILIIYLVIALFTSPITYYVSMAIGQLFTRHKLIGSVVGYFLYSMVSQILSVILLVATTLGKWDLLSNGNIDLDTALGAEQYLNYMNNLLIGQGIIMIILGVLGFFVTKILLEKKLNLD